MHHINHYCKYPVSKSNIFQIVLYFKQHLHPIINQILITSTMTDQQQLAISPPSSKDDVAALYSKSMDDIAAQLSAMQHQESSSSSAYANIDYLQLQDTTNDNDKASSSSSSRHEHILSRSKMCTWSYQLTDMTKLSRLAVIRSMNYLDRFLATHPTNSTASRALHDKRLYQLISMTCLYIAIKLYEPLTMDASLLSEISAGCYTTFEIIDMESIILNALSWRLNGPTSQEYIPLLLGLVKPSEYDYDLNILSSLYDVSLYQCELAAGSYDISIGYKFSVVALGCVLNSMEVMDDTYLSEGARCEFMDSACDMLLGKERRQSIREELKQEVGMVQDELRQLFCQNSSVPSSDSMPAATPSSSSNSSACDDEEVDDDAKMTSSSSSKFNKTCSSYIKKCSSPVSVVAANSNGHARAA